VELPLTPLDFLTRARRLFAAREGVVEWADGIRHTWAYAEFAERADRLAHLLAGDFGVQPGDRVAWLCGNTHHLLEAYYGVLLAGGVLLPLNIRLAPAELRFILDDAGARVLLRHSSLPDPGSAVATVVLDDDYERGLAAQPATPFPTPPVDERAAAELFYTSGSTGRPKGALLTHRGLYLHAVHGALTMGISGNDTVLHTIPLFHVNGWGTPHYLTGLGGVHVMLARFEPAEVLRLLVVEGVTRLYLVPTMVTALLSSPALDGLELPALRQISIGGAPAAPSLLAEVERRFGCEAICGYGMTETSPQLTKALDKPGAPPSAAKRATTGLPIIGVDVRVLDESGREVPWDGATPGEVCVRSNHVMAGYWQRPEETAAAMAGGWLHTQDIAVVDPDGYLTIVDRKKDLIISGGENISSVEVEKVLAAHPAVLEVAVVGTPHERWGEVPRAWVVARPDASVAGDDLVAWARQRLAGFKVPKDVRFVDELPKGGTGKVLKHVLREPTLPD
jgi:fatty-acyl-CoA synthase